MSDVVISYNGSDIAEMSETGTKTLNTQGTYLPSNVQVRYTSPMDNANFIPGIESETYEALFGGEFTVTTAADSEHEHPWAEIVGTDTLDANYYYRVTINGVVHNFIPQFIACSEGSSSYLSTYVGNVTLSGRPTEGLLNEQSDVAFLLFEEQNGKIGIYTNEAGSYTVLIERGSPVYEQITNDLMYGRPTPPFQYTRHSSGFDVFSVGSGRFPNLTQDSRRCAIGFGNVVRGEGAVAISTLGEAAGANACTVNYKNKASGSRSFASGNITIASGNNSHSEGQTTIAAGASSHAEGDANRTYGSASHVEGTGCYVDASQNVCHVGGVNNAISTETGKTITFTRYNEDGTVNNTGTRTLGKYAEVIGNGDSDQARSNARTLDWNGNEAIAGSLTLGLGTANEITLTPAQLATVFVSLLPAVSASDNGKVLQVVNGAWAAATIPSANGVNF